MTSDGTITCPDCEGAGGGNEVCERCNGTGEIPMPARKLTLNPATIAREQSRALQEAEPACWACGATVPKAEAVQWPGFTETLTLHAKCVRKVAESATRRADALALIDLRAWPDGYPLAGPYPVHRVSLLGARGGVETACGIYREMVYSADLTDDLTKVTCPACHNPTPTAHDKSVRKVAESATRRADKLEEIG